MKAILVDDEPLMMHKFARMSKDIEDINIIGQFENPGTALDFMRKDPADIAFIDIEMPTMNGLTLAQKLREIRKDIIIVFVTAFDEYVGDSNAIGGDFYLVKPYTEEILHMMAEKLRMLSIRQHKEVYIQMFGRFVVKKDNIPVKITGRAKEILALIISKHGREISNEEIFRTIWEGRPYSNANMTVYYNALQRLKRSLKKAEIEDIIISTARGQMANVNLFDCDYYSWKEGNVNLRNKFEGEFLSEYTWGEELLADIIQKNQ